MHAVGELQDALRRYDDAMSKGDRAAVVALVDRLVAEGTDPLCVLTEVVVPAQRSIGDRWQRGEWTVAQEHAATAMAMAATEVISRRLGTHEVPRGHVIVTCAEREWHWLPAAIVSCALRAGGWQTTLLVPAISPLRISRYIQDIGPQAVAVSCSVLGALPTTRRFIEACTSAGVPVVVGGAAFGPDAMRAEALGATAWAGDALSAVDAVAGLPVVVSPAEPLPEAPANEQAALQMDQQRIVDRLRREWSVTANLETGPTSSALRALARDTLPQTLHAISAALLTGDSRPLSETAEWLARLLDHRGVESRSAIEELAVLMRAAVFDYPLSADLVRSHFRLAS
ncbi:B12-binding domain-containing protein [Mycobacterium sp. IDR2000157661]|nr:B12-binding domain-containing protein [Mycobacterium sp. IDR2000157661]